MSKIAADAKKKSKAKQWLKNTATIGLGYAAGHGAGMLVNRYLEHHDLHLGKLPPIVLGVAGMGSSYLFRRMMEKRRELEKE